MIIRRSYSKDRSMKMIGSYLTLCTTPLDGTKCKRASLLGLSIRDTRWLIPNTGSPKWHSLLGFMHDAIFIKAGKKAIRNGTWPKEPFICQGRPKMVWLYEFTNKIHHKFQTCKSLSTRVGPKRKSCQTFYLLMFVNAKDKRQGNVSSTHNHITHLDN